MKSSLHLFLYCHFFLIILPTVRSGALNPLLQLPIEERDLIFILAAWDPRYIASGRTHRKHRFLCFCVLIHCCRDMFTAPLRSSERGADPLQRKPLAIPLLLLRDVTAYVTRSSVACVWPLPSNGCFPASTVLAWANTGSVTWHWPQPPSSKLCPTVCSLWSSRYIQECVLWGKVWFMFERLVVLFLLFASCSVSWSVILLQWKQQIFKNKPVLSFTLILFK
jgi:hypothetical protein